LLGTVEKPKIELQRKLNTFDVTSLVVGSIIGADIYVAAAIGAKLVGPASLLVWIAAGAIAIVIALSFAYCVAVRPRVGGPYAYAKEVSSPVIGFTVGWSLLLAEWFSLAVFPVAFAQYASSLFDVKGQLEEIALKGVFIILVVLPNVVGIKAAGRFNDLLTIIKLSPLLLLILAGLAFMAFEPGVVSANLSPFSTGTLGGFGQALVLIFWAYAGFELSTLPADEIESPKRTIPKAIVTGMIIVAAFYLLTNFVIVGTVDSAKLATSSSPLMDSASEIFSSSAQLSGIIPVIIGIGALVSILGADESGTIGTSRLAYALSIDGLMPKVLSRIHSKHGTPYVAVAVLCLTAFIASIVGSLVQLINASVFLLSFVYFATCASAIKLRQKEPVMGKTGYIIPVCGLLFSVALMALVGMSQIIVSIALMLVGLPIYWFFSPKQESHELRKAFFSREAILRRTYEQGERFLAYPWRRLLWYAYERADRKKAWVVEDEVRKHP
jgi:APA family basic amino acid/polyamine antiporter